MALTGVERLIRGYSLSVYVDGSRTLDSISTTYREQVKVCAAGLQDVAVIDTALLTGKITESEYLDTMSYVGTPEALAWKSK